MKYLYSFIFIIIPFLIYAQVNNRLSEKPDSTKQIIIVEASCGQCQFGLKGKGCDLAIRFDGHAYFVTGTNIDEHGDAHAKDGFCKAIRTAEVQGELIDNKFQVKYFKLLKDTVKNKSK